jgi:ABC-type Co2+ transport system permease subunit
LASLLFAGPLEVRPLSATVYAFGLVLFAHWRSPALRRPASE